MQIGANTNPLLLGEEELVCELFQELDPTDQWALTISI